MDDLIGKQLGSYQIVEELGRGGMAVVYRAYQQSLNRYVAIKVLPPNFSFDQEFVQRFQREALSAAKLRHPNIVVIYDVGYEQGIYFIVMELLEGRTLTQIIQEEGALSVERATRIAEQIAAALDFAHGQGLVHRDVKPSNIFVGKDDHTTLTDFGIAKAASESDRLTRTGMLMGTPEYMSPEQAEGKELDYRSDLYALGVVLYQMLVGQVPFRGSTPHAVLHAVIYEPPSPLRRVRPDLPAGIEAVVLKAIDKRPERRFQSGKELAQALKEAPTRAPRRLVVPPSPGARPAQPSKAKDAAAARKPLVWILAAIALVLGGLVIALAIILSGGGEAGGTPAPPTTAVAAIHTPADDGTSAALTATAAAELLPTEITVTDSPEPDTDTPESPTDTPEVPTDTPKPPTDTPTPTPTRTPTPTATPCAFPPQGTFATLWQKYRNKLGCPIQQDPQLIQDAEQPFDNGHMFWRADNDYVYVVYEAGSLAGTYEAYTDMWSEGDPEYSCAASPPPGKVQPRRGFGAVWCHLGGASAAIGWGLQEEAGFGPGWGDPLVQGFVRGLIFRDSDGTTNGLAYVLFQSSKTFVREAY